MNGTTLKPEPFIRPGYVVSALASLGIMLAAILIGNLWFLNFVHVFSSLLWTPEIIEIAAYAFVPIGFMLVALAAIGLVVPSAGLHAWMVGGVGTMTLAVMTRASLGHTGHELIAGFGTQAIYAAVVIAALARVAAAFYPAWTFELLYFATAAWVAAFGGFAVIYGHLLFQRRLS